MLDPHLVPTYLVTLGVALGSDLCTPLEVAKLELARGSWRAWLDSPGGELPFGLELVEDIPGELRAFLLNGPERIAVPKVSVDGTALLLDIEHYDSRVRATISDDGKRLKGEWEKRRGQERWVRMAFHATAGATARFPAGERVASRERIDGRWAVDFASDEQVAVALFEADESGRTVTGTIQTTIGDYRYLAGSFEGDRLRLSVFDGAHAFLFDARLTEEGTLAGDFWSSDSWHDEWTAHRDEDIRLDDAFAQTRWLEGASLADVVLPDLDGKARSLVERELAGRAIIVQLFGSWCPNCNDETAYLTELHDRYAAQGLSILGLAFELTGEEARDAKQLRIFAKRYGIGYPLFLAGVADKARASLAFPQVDRVRSFPTTLFLHGDGRVHSVHSGFAGPATGEAHAALRAEFEATIEELLAEPLPDGAATWAALVAHPWYSRVEFAGARYVFGIDEEGERSAVYTLFGSGRPVLREETLPVRLRGDAVWIGEDLWRLDRRAGVLLHPTRCGARLTPDEFQGSRFLAGRGYEGEAGFARALADPEAIVRREAIIALTYERTPSADAKLPEVHALVGDSDLGVVRAAIWALAEDQDHGAIPAMLELRSHPNAALRRELAAALVRMSKADPRLVAQLEPLATDPDPLVREHALAGLGESGK